MKTLPTVEVMALLDKATNLFGPLKAPLRARLFAVIDNPTQATWEDAHSIIVSVDQGWLTLWQAALRFTAYNVTSKGCDAPWPSIPTREQIAAALTAALEG